MFTKTYLSLSIFNEKKVIMNEWMYAWLCNKSSENMVRLSP